MNKYTQIAQRLLLAAAGVTAVGQAFAEHCIADHLSNNGAFMVVAPKPAIVQTGEANRTWDDWIWRGDQFFCSGVGVNKCSYSWNRSKTTSYAWAVGVEANLARIPVAGAFLGVFGPEGSFTKTKSVTDSFMWTQFIDGGQMAEPVQVIIRRRIWGEFIGASYSLNRKCTLGKQRTPGHMYWWNKEVRWGGWGADKEVGKFKMYHVWFR